MADEEMKRWIDGASYETLLARWRNEPIGSLWFQGEAGEYYAEAIKKKRVEVGDAAAAAASKAIGW